jgi:hypothetical protein
MAREKKITLQTPFMWFDKRVERVVLKEPSGRLYMVLGEPRYVIQVDGGGYFHERDEVIAKYIAELLVMEDGRPFEGGADATLTAMSLADVLAVKAGLLDFFQDAQRAIIAARSNGSSSDGDAQPLASAAA